MRGTAELKKISILYISPHGNTEHMAHAVALGARSDGVEVILHHISHLSPGEVRTIMEEADALVFGIPTIARAIPKPMLDVLTDLSTVKLKATVAALFGSYGWSGEAVPMIEDRLRRLKLRVPVPGVKARLNPTADEFSACHDLGRQAALHLLGRAEHRTLDMSSFS